MSIRRWAARADTTAAEVRDGLREAGFYVWDLRQPFDLLVARDGRMWLVEVKAPGGTLTAAQTRFLIEWPGPRVVIGRTAKEVILQLERAAA